MSRQPRPLYVLDTNVFIHAHKDYYAPDFCPAFWDCIPQFFQAGRLISIDRVFNELKYPGDLVQWANNAPNALFDFSGDGPVISAYRTIMSWVQNNLQFRRAAKRQFAAGADGWLIAYAYVHGAVVVTQEVLAPDARKRVPIPNVCQQFSVPYLNTFEMLRQLGVQFDLRPTT